MSDTDPLDLHIDFFLQDDLSILKGSEQFGILGHLTEGEA